MQIFYLTKNKISNHLMLNCCFLLPWFSRLIEWKVFDPGSAFTHNYLTNLKCLLQVTKINGDYDVSFIAWSYYYRSTQLNIDMIGNEKEGE